MEFPSFDAFMCKWEILYNQNYVPERLKMRLIWGKSSLESVRKKFQLWELNTLPVCQFQME